MILRIRNNTKSLGGRRSVIHLLPTISYDDQQQGRTSTSKQINNTEPFRSRRSASSSKSNMKAIGTLMLLGIQFVAIILHNKKASSSSDNLRFIDMSATTTTTPSNDVVVAHCTEDLKWLDQLYNFDPLVCSHVRIYIYSKCNAQINLREMIPLTANCATIKQVKNCGTQEYAYFQFILDHYESMSPMVSFIQGDALTENPHIIYDMMVNIPGTTYKDLSRHVRESWHMSILKEADREIMRDSFPYLENKKTWLAPGEACLQHQGNK